MAETLQVDRLCALFADRVESGTVPGKTTLRNGSLNLARALGVVPGTISHWRNRSGGRVPLDRYGQIFEAAELAGISRAALADVLLGVKCPCCGRAVEPGAVAA